MKANKQFPENIPPDVALHRNFITMQDVDDWLRDKLVVTSPWASGSFYLATFLVVIIGLGVLASSVPFYVLVIVLISAILFVPLIGALQLKQDKRLSEKGFMELIGMVVGQLPLIGKIARSFGPRTNYSFFF